MRDRIPAPLRRLFGRRWAPEAGLELTLGTRSVVFRFAWPLFLGAIGAVAVLCHELGWVDALFGPVAALRLGITTLLIAGLWAVASGFSLGALRLATLVALGIIVLALTNVGDNVRDRHEFNDYLTLRTELTIEDELARRAATTNAGIEESIQANLAVLERAQRALIARDTALAPILDWLARSCDDGCQTEWDTLSSDAHVRCDSAPGTPDDDALIWTHADACALLDPTRTPESSPKTETDLVALTQAVEDLAALASSDVETLADRIAFAEGQLRTSRAIAGAAVEEESPEARSAAIDLATPASGAREADEVATQTAEDVSLTLESLFPVFASTSSTDFQQWAATSQQVDPSPLPTLSTRIGRATVENRCPDDIGQFIFNPSERVGQVTVSFEAALALAQSCVSGCAGDGGECKPLFAQRVLLIGFRTTLELGIDRVEGDDRRSELRGQLDSVRTQLRDLNEPEAIHRLVVEGADEFLGDTLDTVLRNDTSARIGGWGWLVITLAIIIGYRFLEIANDSRSPGPIRLVKDEKGEKETDADTRRAADLIRAHLTAVELQEPAPVPGGAAISSISSAAQNAGFENAILNFVATALQSTAFPPRGIELRPVVQKTDDGSFRLLLRASTARGNRQVLSHPFGPSDDLDDLAEQAAFFAAEQFIDEGTTTPSWLVWSSKDGTALQNYQKVMIEERGPTSALDRATKLAHLQEAVHRSPGTGAALVALANAYSVEGGSGDLARATNLLLKSRIRHPHYLNGRYRLGATLSMLSVGCEASLIDLRGPDRATRDEVMQRLEDLHKIEEGPESTWPNPDAARPAPGEKRSTKQCVRHAWEVTLLRVAKDELEWVCRNLGFWRTLWNARRQEERAYWHRLNRAWRRRKALRGAAMSALALVELRLALRARDADTQEIETALERSRAQLDEAQSRGRDDWVVQYNSACFEAAAARTIDLRHLYEETDGSTPEETSEASYEASRDRLRRSRWSSGGQQLTGAWIARDPDLKPLRDYLLAQPSHRPPAPADPPDSPPPPGRSGLLTPIRDWIDDLRGTEDEGPPELEPPSPEPTAWRDLVEELHLEYVDPSST
ncbi:MAG: hypothetical protein AAGA90_11270 [Actinomycetota bacterium]